MRGAIQAMLACVQLAKRKGPSGPFLTALVTALVLALPAQALTARLSTGDVVTINTAGDLQIAVRVLIAQGLTDDARRLARAFQPGDADHAVRVAYVDGLAASAEGRDAEAVEIYRAVLAQRPELDLVRIALTQALARLQLYDTARVQAERLIAAGVDDRLDGQLSGLLRALDEQRPVTARGYVSLLPSTNINNGSDRKTVAFGNLTGRIPKESRKTSGLGFAAGGQLAFRAQMDPRHAVIGVADLRVEHYPSIERTNTSGQLSFGIERRVARGDVLVRALAGGSMVDGDRTYRYHGLGLEANLRLGDRWRLYVGPEYRYERFDGAPGDEGHYLNVPVQLDRFGGPDRFVRYIAGVAVGRKEEERFSFDEARLGLGYFREFPLGVSAYVEGTVAKRRYKGLYPGLDEAREDERLILSLTLTKRDLVVAGFAPQMTLRTQRNKSNAAFNDTSSSSVDLRLTRDF
ncbi:surface lipoprotein assembly modifier [Pseudaestuariivita sp.]|uniref:surface lipoprotein assembly modifier n=1 Tax=Pseudaestuariivita sp. TaxID=2211669 RepID=UPI00405A09FE